MMNSAANVVARVWSMVSIYLFVPVYISLLGEEQYGLISFFTTLQAIANLLGGGLSGTLRREFAIGGGDEDNGRLYRLLRSIEVIYAGVSILFVVLFMLGAPWISSQWLNLGEIDPATAAQTLRLMSVSISVQLFTYLYYGALMGSGHQVKANTIHFGWSFVKQGGAALVLLLADADVRVFYLWHILTDVIYFVVMRRSVSILIKDRGGIKWAWSDIRIIKSISKYALGILTISLIAVLNRELDKLVISGLMDIENLARYNIAYMMASIPSTFASALSESIFPIFARVQQEGENRKLAKHFEVYFRLISVIVVCLGAFIALFRYDLLLIWTNSSNIADSANYACLLLTAGHTMLALQVVPYQLALACGNTKINVFMGLVSVPLLALILPILTRLYGITGAAGTFLILQTATNICYGLIIYRRYVGSGSAVWILRDTILPIVGATLSAFAFYELTKRLGMSAAVGVCVGVAGGIATVVLSVLCRPSLRGLLKGVKQHGEYTA